jgi:hypothetical protein
MTASPEDLQRSAPKAWQYLLANGAVLAKRGSSIYRNRPRFSIFGVGEYSFSPWKVAISGLYKKLEFVEVPPFRDRPVVLDDTCYFFPCQSKWFIRQKGCLFELRLGDQIARLHHFQLRFSTLNWRAETITILPDEPLSGSSGK